MPNQQSFGNLIIDERGIEERMLPSLKSLLTRVFADIKRTFGKSELANQKERDVLVHPFQDISGSGGIMVTHPYRDSTGYRHSTAFYWDNDLSQDLELRSLLRSDEIGINGYIRHLLSPHKNYDTITFKEAAKDGEDVFFNVEKPLSDDMLQGRFGTNLIIKIPNQAVGFEKV